MAPLRLAAALFVALLLGAPLLQAGFELRGHLDRQAHGLTDAGSITLRLQRRDQITDESVILLIVGKTTLQADDGFAFTGLESGTYTISIETAAGETYVHRTPIEIDEASLENLALIPVTQD